MISEQNLKLVFNTIKVQIENSVIYVVELHSDENKFDDLYSDEAFATISSVFISISDFIDNFSMTLSNLFLTEDVLVDVINNIIIFICR